MQKHCYGSISMPFWHLDILHDTFVMRKIVVWKLCSHYCHGDLVKDENSDVDLTFRCCCLLKRTCCTNRNTTNELNELTMSCHRMYCSEWRESFLITVSGNRNRIYWHKYFLIFLHHVLYLWNIWNSFIRPLFTCKYLTFCGCDWLQSQCVAYIWTSNWQLQVQSRLRVTAMLAALWGWTETEQFFELNATVSNAKFSRYIYHVHPFSLVRHHVLPLEENLSSIIFLFKLQTGWRITSTQRQEKWPTVLNFLYQFNEHF